MGIKSMLLICLCSVYAFANPPILWTIDFSPDGKFYAVGGDDRILSIYDAKSYRKINFFTFPRAIQCQDWSSDGKQLAIALDDSPVRIFDIGSGKFYELTGTTGSRALSWNHDGQLLAVGDYEGALQIWNRERLFIKSIKKDNNKTYLSIHWHPSKNVILTGSDKIRIFDAGGNLLHSIKHRHEATILISHDLNDLMIFINSGIVIRQIKPPTM